MTDTMSVFYALLTAVANVAGPGGPGSGGRSTPFSRARRNAPQGSAPARAQRNVDGLGRRGRRDNRGPLWLRGGELPPMHALLVSASCNGPKKVVIS